MRQLFAALVVAAQTTDPESVPGWARLVQNAFPFLLILAIFYFLLLGPARKRQKQQQKMLENLKNGDKVVTSGGVFGTVVAVTDRIVQLKISDSVKIDVLKSAVAGLQSEERPGA
ncbi:MAG: preprotein translocase subunit YajC [Acidobacteriota bacterium]